MEAAGCPHDVSSGISEGKIQQGPGKSSHVLSFLPTKAGGSLPWKTSPISSNPGSLICVHLAAPTGMSSSCLYIFSQINDRKKKKFYKLYEAAIMPSIRGAGFYS